MIQDVGNVGSPGTGQGTTAQQQADNAFNLEFESLLQIVLTQLTYQDPLKPVENFEFVSQLAQFSQIQQTSTMSDRLDAIFRAEATAQATSLLGRIVEIPAGNTVLSGKVTGINFTSGQPRLTIDTDGGQTISNIALASVSNLRLADGD